MSALPPRPTPPGRDPDWHMIAEDAAQAPQSVRRSSRTLAAVVGAVVIVAIGLVLLLSLV